MKPGGRGKKTKLDKKILAHLISIGCTDNELAAFFKCTTRTIENCRKYPEYAEIFSSAKETRNISLRRAQWKLAVEKGNPTMLIWLGKLLLGQKDKSYMTHDGPNGGPIPIKMDGMTDEELNARILELAAKTAEGGVDRAAGRKTPKDSKGQPS